MPAPPNHTALDATALARELRNVVNRGAWASALNPAELPCLLGLACVAGPAEENRVTPHAQLIIVLKHVLEPKEEREDAEPGNWHPNANRALALLLGTA